MTYAGVSNHLLWRYATDANIYKADEDIRNFKEGSLVVWDFLQAIESCTKMR